MMDLETFRLDQRLTYRKLGELVGQRHPGQIRSWALGQAWPDADKLQRIVERTNGAVTIEAMHRRRLQWLAERRGISLNGNHGLSVTDATIW